ncbi:MAG: TolC family protein, partial [Burkholderiales bacterium]|nr:TolC family protein [Burkholderiales bacterium]
ASGGARAQATLSLDQALQRAAQRSRQLASQEAAASSERERAVAAGQRPDPTLELGIDNLPVDTQDRFSLMRDFMTMRTVGVMQELTRGAKLAARSARYERAADTALAERALALARLRRDTASAWFARYYADRVLALVRRQRDEAVLQVDAAEAAYRGGRGAQADVFAARSAVAQIDDRILQAQQQAASAQTTLARWVGAAATQPLAEPPPLALAQADAQAGAPAAAAPPALDRHPEIVLLRRQERQAQADAALARADRDPDWSIALRYSQRGPAYSNMVSVSLSVPLTLDRANRQDRELAARLATVEQLRDQREEAARALQAEIARWQQAWQSDRERLAHYDHALIPLAAERTQAATAAYRGGGGSLAAVLDARRAEIDVRIDRVRLEADAAERWAALEYLGPGAMAGADPSADLATTPRER